MEDARQDLGKVSDPKAPSLFETAAEVPAAINKAYGHFEERAEGASKTASTLRK